MVCFAQIGSLPNLNSNKMESTVGNHVFKKHSKGGWISPKMASHVAQGEEAVMAPNMPKLFLMTMYPAR
jgi:hypothetical protein